MGQIFAGLLIFYIIVAAITFPMIAADSCLKNRDCKAKHGVEQCVIVYVPAEEPTP